MSSSACHVRSCFAAAATLASHCSGVGGAAAAAVEEAVEEGEVAAVAGRLRNEASSLGTGVEADLMISELAGSEAFESSFPRESRCGS